MATYIIGDVQGCLSELKALMSLIDYNPAHDRLGFVGDLVNRGPDSLQALRFIKKLDNPIILLGNHDLGLLALYYGLINKPENHALSAIIRADDCGELMDWLAQQKIIEYLPDEDFLIVHAGVPPQWDKEQALSYASEIEQCLRSDDILPFLSHMYGDKPTCWDEKLTHWDRLRYITNAFTRMRFCGSEGELDIHNKTNVTTSPKFKPWFEWYTLDTPIVFGHWASLNGHSTNPNCYAIDTGCVWGHQLSAFRLDDCCLFSVPSTK